MKVVKLATDLTQINAWAVTLAFIFQAENVCLHVLQVQVLKELFVSVKDAVQIVLHVLTNQISVLVANKMGNSLSWISEMENVWRTMWMGALRDIL